MKEHMDTNKDQKRAEVRRKLALHDKPFQTVWKKNKRIWFDKV